MEDLDNENPNPNQIRPIKISVRAAEITSKFKSIKDRQGFCREMSKIIFIIFRPFFPKKVGFDSTFFLQVLRGDKKVSAIYLCV